MYHSECHLSLYPCHSFFCQNLTPSSKSQPKFNLPCKDLLKVETRLSSGYNLASSHNFHWEKKRWRKGDQDPVCKWRIRDRWLEQQKTQSQICGVQSRASGCSEGAAQRSVGWFNCQSPDLFWPCSSRSRCGNTGWLKVFHRLVVVHQALYQHGVSLSCFVFPSYHPYLFVFILRYPARNWAWFTFFISQAP